MTCRFTKQIDATYQSILEKLEQSEPDLANLAQEYQQVAQRDYFHSKLGQQVRSRLMAARGDEQ